MIMSCNFWDVTPCRLINSHRRFREANCIHLRRPTHLLQLLDPEDEDRRLLRNVGNYLGLQSEIWVSYGGIDEGSSLLGCYTMSTAWPWRWKRYSSPKICCYLPVDMASHARYLESSTVPLREYQIFQSWLSSHLTSFPISSHFFGTMALLICFLSATSPKNNAYRTNWR